MSLICPSINHVVGCVENVDWNTVGHSNLPGSEHMIDEFQNHWEEEYKIITSEQLQSVIDKRNTLNEKNAQTQHTIRIHQYINLLSPLIHTCTVTY